MGWDMAWAGCWGTGWRDDAWGMCDNGRGGVGCSNVEWPLTIRLESETSGKETDARSTLFLLVDAPVPVAATTGFGALAELKYRPPEREKKEEYGRLQPAAGSGCRSRVKEAIVALCKSPG